MAEIKLEQFLAECEHTCEMTEAILGEHDAASTMRKLLAIIRVQDKWLHYIAESSPMPTQTFELENRNAAREAQAQVRKVLENPANRK